MRLARLVLVLVLDHVLVLARFAEHWHDEHFVKLGDIREVRNRIGLSLSLQLLDSFLFFRGE